MLVGDGDPVGRDGLQRGNHRRGVGGVGNQEHLVRADEVGDQIIDPAGFVAAQGVLGLAGPILARSLVSVEFTKSAAPGPTPAPAQVADVEDPAASRTAVCSATVPAYDTGVPAAETGEKQPPARRGGRRSARQEVHSWRPYATGFHRAYRAGAPTITAGHITAADCAHCGRVDRVSRTTPSTASAAPELHLSSTIDADDTVLVLGLIGPESADGPSPRTHPPSPLW